VRKLNLLSAGGRVFCMGTWEIYTKFS